MLAGRKSLLKQKIRTPEDRQSQPQSGFPDREAYSLAKKYYRWNRRKREQLVDRLHTFFTQAVNKDFLVIHSPGGWGNTQWEGLLGWEKSIVTGVTSTLKNLGYSYSVVQYFRSGDGWIRHMMDIPKEARFFFSGGSPRAKVMSEELNLILNNMTGSNVILVGASQGAAFNNLAMRKLGEHERIYSIELGIFFPHVPRRVISKQTLAIDSNGIQPDPMCHRNLWAGTKSYIKAFYRWFKGHVEGKPVKFTHCINTPGHEYQWEYPAVHKNITEFLTARFGMKTRS
jgi:hypothetical protein